MKILVSYYSQTGNTEKLAKAIYDEIKVEKELKNIENIDDLEGYDLIFVGFPVMQFGPADAARVFIEEKAKNKNIVLFVTHAMDPSSENPQQKEMLNGILEQCKASASNSNLIGFFHCQGELAESVANFLVKSRSKTLQEFAKLRETTIGHPTNDEIEEARIFTRELLKDL